MSDITLPESIDDWPKNPFALLGVPQSVSPGDLKRTYTRLIRLYRPERMPEHFRLIREAYEAVQQFVAWTEAHGNARETEQSFVSAIPSGMEVHPPESQQEAEGIPKIESPEKSWRLAIHGELERAYLSLQNQRERLPQQPSIYLQLYWLLAAKPDLDTLRAPHDWVMSGLAVCPQYSSLLEIAEEELAEDPRLAISSGFNSLLENAPGSLLADLLKMRWRAASRLEWWKVPLADLEAFHDRVCRHDETTWLRLLLMLAGICFAAEDPDDTGSILQACGTHLRNLSHLGIKNGSEFDRAELLFRLANEADPRSRRKTKNATVSPWSVLGLVRHFIAGQMEETASAVEELMALVCRMPRDGLRILDQAAELAPLTFNELGVVLDWYSWNNARAEPLQQSASVAWNLTRDLISRFTGTYPDIRLCVLDFCCAESISPEFVSQQLIQPDAAFRYISERIVTDLPLRLTYQIHCLGWLR